MPVDFQIDRAKQMVRDLDPEIRRSMHVIAKEEVALEQLNQQIAGNQDKADKDKKDILRLQADLGQNKNVYHYASRTYTSDEVKQDLSRRFSRFKVADDTLASMKQMRDAREKNLDAAQQKLSAMINARRKLEVDVQNLEAKRKLVEVAQASSEYVFDDSQLARAKELITDIRTRLDVAAKLANADVNVASGDSAGRRRPGRHHRPGDRVLQARRQATKSPRTTRRERSRSRHRQPSRTSRVAPRAESRESRATNAPLSTLALSHLQ